MSDVIFGEYDAIKDEQITRPATQDEKNALEAEIADFDKKVKEELEASKLAILAKKTAQEKLAALGLTVEELKALGIA